MEIFIAICIIITAVNNTLLVVWKIKDIKGGK